MRIFLLILCALPLWSASPAVKSLLPLMPWPASITTNPDLIPIDKDFSIAIAGAGAKDPRIAAAVQRTFEQLAAQTGIIFSRRVISENTTLAIAVEEADHRGPQRLGDDERYSLDISNGRARLSADAPLGALRGLETFLQLVGQCATPVPGFCVQGATIRDEPRFPWRGLSLDVSRHFLPIPVIRRNIDGLAAVKLNVLHWHLSDDQGFRVESKKYPRLQQYGSDSLYYTQEEIRDVVAYARDRGVRIVPEFDIPGHATSWLPGYPELGSRSGQFEIGQGYGGAVGTDLIDPTKESTYRFLDGFVGEMAKLFPDEYFHIGGDEVNPKQWNANPQITAFMRKHKLADGKALQTYFNQRLLKILTKHGKRMEGWDEILDPDLPKTAVVQSWRGQESLWQAAHEGYRGILSAGYYLDLMQPASQHYAIDPLVLPADRVKRLQDQNKPIPTPLTAEEQKNILGGEAAMWEELADAENVDAKLWPRLAAIAERFWSPQSITDVSFMYRRLDATNHWLEWLGLTQRSSLEEMRQRLAGDMPYQPLDAFASILEPVKGYARGAGKYMRFTPLNRLVDSISPESNTAREFRDSVNFYIANPSAGTAINAALVGSLTAWQQDVALVHPLLENEPMLKEDIPVADAMATLCRIGLEALQYLSTGNASAQWKSASLATVTDLSKRQGDFVLPIAPGIQKLVESVTAP